MGSMHWIFKDIEYGSIYEKENIELPNFILLSQDFHFNTE